MRQQSDELPSLAVRESLAMRPNLNVKKKVQALERRKAQFDALIKFIKTHPLTACEGRLFAFAHRTGLMFDDYAVIRPMWDGNKPALRLEKYSEDWFAVHPEDDPLDFTERTVCDDVSRLSDKKVMAMLEKIHRELVPEDFENDEEE
jgi:hypothetical protein